MEILGKKDDPVTQAEKKDATKGIAAPRYCGMSDSGFR
jgi:hypothetical protein